MADDAPLQVGGPAGGGPLELLARAGYAARGFVYVAVGVLAVVAALRVGSGPAGSRSALAWVHGEPWGEALLWVVAVGLAAFVLWRVVQALLDPGRRGTDAEGLLHRAGYVLSAVIHGGLVLWLVRELLRSGGGGGPAADEESAQARRWTAELMGQPFGPWLVMAVGVGVLAFAARQLVRAWRGRAGGRLPGDVSRRARDMAELAGRLGHAARGVAFAIMGAFLVVAGWTASPARARGLEGALQTLESQPYGPWMLGAVGVGLGAYGAFQWITAALGRIDGRE